MEQEKITPPKESNFNTLKPGILCIGTDENGQLVISTVKYSTLAEEALKKENEKQK